MTLLFSTLGSICKASVCFKLKFSRSMKDYPYMSGSLEKETRKRTKVRNKQALPNRKTALFENQCDGTYHWVQYVRLALVLTIKDLFLRCRRRMIAS